MYCASSYHRVAEKDIMKRFLSLILQVEEPQCTSAIESEPSEAAQEHPVSYVLYVDLLS